VKIAIVTDSTAYIPADIIKQHNIHVVPLSVNFGEETYREGFDMTTEEFYARMKKEKELPSTSQPAIGEFVSLFEQLSAHYDAVISLHLSGKFSGTFNAAQSAGGMVDHIAVYPFDTELSAMVQGLFVIAAAEQAELGKSPEEILIYLNDMKARTRAYFMVDDLTNLQKGGRLNSAQAILGSVLNIKPILHIVDGLIVPYEKIRTRKKAIKRIIGMLEDDAKEKELEKVVFIHGNNEKAALKLRDQFAEKHPEVETIISYFGPVIGTHLGDNSIGVAWCTK